MYPSIPIEHSIHVILNFIENYNDPTYPPLCFIKNLLPFVLKYNCFNFADLFFLQVRGVAMEPKWPPTMRIFTWLILRGAYLQLPRKTIVLS